MTTATADGTASLDKALDVLEAIGASMQGLSQAQLADQLGLPRTTLYRMLGTLVARGLVRRDAERRVYCLGFRCFEYARQAYAMPDVVAAATPELRMLRDLTGETAYLAVRDGNEVLSLERYDGAHSHRSAAVLGQRKPMHCTSQGKAILSAMPEAERAALVRDLALRRLTARTITDRRRLNAELKLTSERGYSIDDEEIVLGVRCVGAPIVDGQQRVRGAISVAGPAYRLTVSRLELLGPEVAQAARRIGQQLAGSGTLTGDAASTLIDGEWAFEGAFPRWSPFDQCLYWADALAPAVRRFDGKEDRALATLASPIAGLVPDEHGVLVRREGGWDHVDREGRSRAVSGWPDAPLFALCRAPDGELWASQPSGTEWKVGTWSAEQRFRVHWKVSERVDALAWNIDGTWLYAAAPESGSIYRMQPGQRIVRRLATMPKGSGRISGLALDASEGIWTALKGGWGVVRFAPDGTLDRVVGLPVPSPTGVCVGGPDRSVLYVTSARHEVPIEVLADAPLSGRLFAVPTEVGGIT